MKHLISLSLLSLCFSSCGSVSKSTLHSRSQRKAFEQSTSKNKSLPEATIQQGNTVLAYKHRIGFPPMFGGYRPTLLAENSSIVKVFSDNNDTYLQGLTAGTTKIYRVNAFISPEMQRSQAIGRTPYYLLTVTP